MTKKEQWAACWGHPGGEAEGEPEVLGSEAEARAHLVGMLAAEAEAAYRVQPTDLSVIAQVVAAARALEIGANYVVVGTTAYWIVRL